MTLGEKIAALRGEQKLSQGDLADKLDVSRQSVSKWETGQAVPELDKIIKLADLFGVNVDDLVRDGEVTQTHLPKTELTERIVYVERPREGLRSAQRLGIAMLVVGIVMLFCGRLTVYLPIFGVSLALLSLPLILAKKHPWLIAGWLLCLGSCVVLNPYTSVCPWGLLDGIYLLYLCLTQPGLNYSSNQFGAAIAIIRGTLGLALICFTVLACWKRWKAKQAEQ